MDYTYTYDRFYIIESQKLAGRLIAGTYLSTKWEVIWFDDKEKYLTKCDELGIEVDTTEELIVKKIVWYNPLTWFKNY